MLIVWEWELYLFNQHDDDETTTEEESSEDEAEIESTRSLSHKLTFKCIGATKSVKLSKYVEEGA